MASFTKSSDLYRLINLTSKCRGWERTSALHLLADQNWERLDQWYLGTCGNCPFLESVRKASIRKAKSLTIARVYQEVLGSKQSQPANAQTNDKFQLLLQVDSDVHTGMVWGDEGRIYFWIHEADLREKRFDRVWLRLQCY